MPNANEIRQQFIDFFVQKCGHTFVPSSPCVPQDDPTLLFTNAGMNQFKPIFLGQQAADVDKWPGATAGLPTRAANTQKCIRAGGKHNDLDDVGHDTYHHTFFEMLGNWSFGDYFKQEAITWAWELLTKVWGIDPERLHATYFQGDEAEGLEPDTEARDLWRAILPAERVHPGNKKDNFWEMGDTGPCGPCSEIHIDLTPDKSGGRLVNAGDARVMEIWNLVFIQFNRAGDGKLTPLPAKHVDTGMGFERLCSVLQGMAAGRLGRFSNYDTDVFTPIFSAIQKVTGAGPYTGLLEDVDRSAAKPDIMKDVAYRVIADHLRTLTFAVTDGAMPSNEGRGYVLRRILRRAVRYGRQYLNQHEPFLCKLVPALVEAMGGVFPELKKSPSHVIDVIRDEETSFLRTLDRGIALFEEAAAYAQRHHHGRIKGEDAFKLHDTFGFPIDLTELMAVERGLTVDIGEYDRLMEEARERARGAQSAETFGRLLEVPKEHVSQVTDDSAKYVQRSTNAVFLFATGFSDERLPESAPARLGLVFDRTCMYAEQGGQVGDSGHIEFENGASFDVIDTRRAGNVVVHVVNGNGAAESLRPGMSAEIRVNSASREPIQKNHTATHVLNWALREVLGEHVQQKGSLVDAEKTRFDLSHPSQIHEEELARIESLVNQQIQQNLAVHAKEVPQKEALTINGLRAVFGEKYPEVVRVVSIGPSVDELLADPANKKWRQYSIEFCGGTHLNGTGQARRFRLVEESAVAKGIRRVVGVTGDRAEQAEAAATALARQLADAGRIGDESLVQRIAEITAIMNQAELPVVEKAHLRGDLTHLQEKARKLAKQAARAGEKDIMGRVDELLSAAEMSGSTSIIVACLPGATVDNMRAAADALRARAGSAAVFLAGDADGKAVLLAALTKDLNDRGIKAGDLIRDVAPAVGGKGGGRPDMAQGGGPDGANIGDAVKAAKSWLRGKLGG